MVPGQFKSPFPYFGGKSSVINIAWPRLGADVPNYVEPFFGSGAVLLNRPGWSPDANWIETVNDLSGFLANFWRSVRDDPDQVAYYADQPVNEIDLHARHVWLVERSANLSDRMEGDPDYHDAKIAGWWVWGACCWIGSGWCSGRGPWQRVETADGWRLEKADGNAGMGVNRQQVHLRNAGMGVNHDGVNAGTGEQGLYAWMQALSERLRSVRVCCGDWSRICGPTPTFTNGITGVFLDPPYSKSVGRDMDLYEIDLKHEKNRGLSVNERVYEWCRANENNKMLRIALCGYAGEYDLPGWEQVAWKTQGGYGNQGDGRGRENAAREMIWFSPYCLKPKIQVQAGLFDQYDDEPVYSDDWYEPDGEK